MIRGHGLPLDHVAFAFADTQAGVRHVEELTGVAPRLTKRDPKDFFWSAALGIGEGSFLEVIGPNPDHRGMHPLKSLLAGLKEPTLLFWYVATDDFEAFARRIAAAGEKLTHVVAVEPGTSANRSHYTRAAIGSRFISQRPGVIEWRRRSLDLSREEGCRLTDFSLSLPEPDALNALFAALAIGLTVERGPNRIGLTLASPKGDVVIENPGYALTPMKMLAAIVRRPFG